MHLHIEVTVFEDSYLFDVIELRKISFITVWRNPHLPYTVCNMMIVPDEIFCSFHIITSSIALTLKKHFLLILA